MKTIFAAIILCALSLPAHANEPIPELAPLAPFIGSWKTIGGSVDGSNKFEDISKWEWAFGGKIVKITHSVNQGAYYGESLIGWDAQQEKIVYRYVNNAGFYTDGVITPQENGAISVHEMVRGSLSGPSETLSEYRVGEDGLLHTWAQLKTGEIWSEKNIATYKRSPDAVVVFKD